MATMNEQFYLVYQPIVFVSENLEHHTREYEVLLRSRETHRFPKQIFDRLLRSETEYSAFMLWYAKTLEQKLIECPEISVSVNIQLDQFCHEGTRHFLEILAPYATRVIIEMTEHEPQFLEQEKIDTCFAQIRAQGFLIALDDVNTGRNNLQLLEQYASEVYRLKFSLLHFKELSPANLASLLEGWRHVAKMYKKEFVVEGIESSCVSKYLSEQGICLQQGYLFGKGSCLSCE